MVFAQSAPTATEGPVTPAAAALPVNIQDDNETSTEKNALYSVLRVIGSGVTPFNLNRQKTLLNALGQVISTIDFNKIYITDVNPVFASRRRQLLMEAEYQQVTPCPHLAMVCPLSLWTGFIQVRLVAAAGARNKQHRQYVMSTLGSIMPGVHSAYSCQAQ